MISHGPAPRGSGCQQAWAWLGAKGHLLWGTGHLSGVQAPGGQGHRMGTQSV